MPCDSPAAALVALGAMRRRLCVPTANDVASHYERLRSFSTSSGPSPVLRWATKRASKFLVQEIDGSGLLWAREANSSTGFRKIITQSRALEWWVDGEPQVQVLPGISGARLPFQNLYDDLIQSPDKIQVSNLDQSDSGICLAGRTTGEAATKRVASAIKFRVGEEVADTSQLLSIFGWSTCAISRVTFFNSRNGKVDRDSIPPRIVVADGDLSFLKAVDHSGFHRSDVIAILHRTLERDRLEAVGQKIADLGQWYEHDAEAASALSVPPGISISLMRRR